MIKRLVVAAAAGAIVMGAVTAFAASMNVGSSTLGSGNASVSACNSAAATSYTPVWDATGKDYAVGQVSVTTSGTGTGCAGQAYRITLTDANGGSIGESTGTLGADGSNSSAGGNGGTGGLFATTPAASVAGIQVVISG